MCLWAANRSSGYVSGNTQYGALNPPCAITYGPQGNNATSAPWNLFLNQANEENNQASDPFAVVRIYGGTSQLNNPKGSIAVQLAVTAQARVAGWFLANSLYRCFCLTNQEKQLRMVSIPGFKVANNSSDGTWTLVDAMPLGTPGQVGTDERGRIKLVSNFDLGFFKAA